MSGLNQNSTKGVILARTDILDIVRHFKDAEEGRRFTPALGLSALHDAVNTAFAHTDLEDSQRENVNLFINALQDLYETVSEQDQEAEAFVVEREDLRDITENLHCLRQVICIQHSELRHHDISTALLWAKTALRRLAERGWNAGLFPRGAVMS
ncbi:MAG: hypothetical protein CBB87_06920 [Micavibrio sp. TMED27]|nr:hypothetical protein [Micavibrio sp.]OUT91043.1 MAG: hypothetical protein CBB87_06920 [Micavibrio sp. TMED27]|tara:strand:+ start:1815 stop:2276 length:462 start_codon:yes stop_codon:yes gene_type:complete